MLGNELHWIWGANILIVCKCLSTNYALLVLNGILWDVLSGLH